MCQPVTLSEHIVDLVNLPLPPPGRKAGAHRGHAGGFIRLQCRIASGVITHEAAGLGRDGVESVDECIEALADVGGVEGVVFECES